MEDSFANDSFITGAKYNTETQYMTIYFGESSFECEKVPLEIWEEFKQAKSKGKYFNTYIKGKFNNEYF